MKVFNIAEQENPETGKPYWIVSFEGKKMTFTDWDTPTYAVGDELPYELELMKPEGKKWYWKKRGVASSGGSKPATTSQSTVKQEGRTKSYSADPAKIESIELQNDKNNAAKLYCHVTEQGTPFDSDMLNKLFRACQALGVDVVSVAKKEYGAVEK